MSASPSHDTRDPTPIERDPFLPDAGLTHEEWQEMLALSEEVAWWRWKQGYTEPYSHLFWREQCEADLWALMGGGFLR